VRLKLWCPGTIPQAHIKLFGMELTTEERLFQVEFISTG